MSWLKNPRIQRNAFYGVATVSSLTAGLWSCSPVILSNSYADMYAVRQQRSKDTPYLQRIQSEVFEDMKLNEKEKQNITFFDSLGWDYFSFGHLGKWLSFPCKIGLPMAFYMKDLIDVPVDFIKIEAEELDWGNEETATLISSFILSDKAKKFIIAKKILELKSWYLGYKTCLSTGLTIGYFTAAMKINRTNPYNSFNLRAKTIANLCLILPFWLIYTFTNDTCNYFKEVKADKLAANLGLEYAEGGVEYYQQIILRNKAGRKLSPVAETMYTAGGNDEVLIRVPAPTYTERISKLEVIAEEMKHPVAS